MTKYIVTSALSFAAGIFVLGLCKVHQDTRVADGVGRLADNAAAALNTEERMAEVQARIEMIDRDQERTAERLDRYAEKLTKLLNRPQIVDSVPGDIYSPDFCAVNARVRTVSFAGVDKTVIVPSGCSKWYADEFQSVAKVVQ